MEEQDDEIVVRQKLVTDEIENDMDDEQINLNSSSVGTTIAAATTIHHQNSNLSKSSSILPILSNISNNNNNNNKENIHIKENNSKHNKTKNLITVTTGIAPISPILSIKQMFSSGETTRTQDSSNCSIDKGNNSDNVNGGVGIGGVGSDSAGAVGGIIGTGGGNGLSGNFGSDTTINNIVGYGNGIAVSNNNNSGQHSSSTRVIFVNERKQQQHNINNNTNNNINNNNNNNINNNNNNSNNNNNNNLQDGKSDYKAKARKAQRDPSNIVDTHDFQNTFENRRLKHHSFLSEVPDVRHMEEALLGLLDDFHTGKLTAFGPGCTMEQMTDIREQQERLAKLHFELVSKCTDNNDNDNVNITTGSSNNSNKRNSKNANENKQQNDNADIMVQLVQKLENLSVSIEKLQSSNNNNNNNNCNNSDVINNNNKTSPSSGGVNKSGSSRLSSGMTGTSKLLPPTPSSSAIPLTSTTAAV